MKKITILLVFTLLSIYSIAQTQGIAYTAIGKGVATPFVTDYHCLGINASALGWGTGYQNKHLTAGTSEFGLGIFSDSLNSDKLKNLSRSIYNQVFNRSDEPFNYSEQAKAAEVYAKAGISVFADYNWIGIAFQNEKFGGIAFNIRDSYSYYSKINSQVSDILFRGKFSNYFDSLTVVFGTDTTRIKNQQSISQDTLNAVIAGTSSTPLSIAQLTNGTEIRMAWNRSYNIGYGRKILGNDSTFIFYGGIGGRFIQSIGMFDLKSDDNSLIMYSSMSPGFDINYGNVNGSNVLESNSGRLQNAIGNGYGLDFSASALLFKRLKLSLAVNNIGSVTYKRNVYRIEDTIFSVYTLQGLKNENIINSVNELLRDGGMLKLIGEQKYVVKNASDIRFGAAFDFGKYLKIGFDFVSPFDRDAPGAIVNPIYSFGAEIRPFRWLILNAGYYGGGVYQHNVPIGVTVVMNDGGFEFGIASRDAFSFMTKNGHSVSTAFGFCRLRF